MLNAVFLFYTALELQRTDVAALSISSSYSSESEQIPAAAQIFNHLAELLHCRGAAGQGRY